MSSPTSLSTALSFALDVGLDAVDAYEASGRDTQLGCFSSTSISASSFRFGLAGLGFFHAFVREDCWSGGGGIEAGIWTNLLRIERIVGIFIVDVLAVV